jgi:hypothetical protein
MPGRPEAAARVELATRAERLRRTVEAERTAA